MNTSSIAVAKMMSYDTSYSSGRFAGDITIPYERTYEMCNEHTVCMISGNVIKHDSYSLMEPYIVSNNDTEFRILLEKMRLEQSVVHEQDALLIDDVNADSEDDNFSLLTADMDEYEDSIPEEIQ